MKLLKSLSGLAGLCLFLFFTQSNLSSCQKETVYDTVFVRDTIRITDTADCKCYDLKAGLVAHYNFNGGTLNDSSGYNNHIIFNNATKTTDRFGRPNNAYLFNGTSSYMKANNSVSLNPDTISIVAIVKFNGFYMGACHQNQIIKKGYKDQDDGIYGLRAADLGGTCAGPVDPTKEFFYGYYGNNQTAQVSALDTTTFISTSKWYTVVFTYDKTQARIYIDGKLRSISNRAVPFTPNTDGLFLGRAENPAYPYWFNGTIDEIRIYKRTLCESEVKWLSDLKD